MQIACRTLIVLALLLLAPACVSPLQRDLQAVMEPPEMQGVRWGLLVTDRDGHELAALNPDQRFLPASNTKLFTTAAVFRWQAELDAMSPRLATFVTLEETGEAAAPDVVLHGRGDPELRDTPDCETRCLSELADAVAATGLTEVGAVIGDDTWFPDDRWRPGWSWDDLQTAYGTAVSALTVNDNVLELVVTPGSAAGDPAAARWAEGDAVYALTNLAVTSGAEDADLHVGKLPGDPGVRVSGAVRPQAPVTLRLGMDDPARVAALRLRALLEQRGVAVTGAAMARHRPPQETPAPDAALTALGAGAAPLAALAPPAWQDVAMDVSKDSQNLYAELLLRHLGHISEDGSAEAGLERVTALLAEAGINPNGYDLFDGSGMSVYNRVSPRTIVGLLTYAAAQDWGEAWRETFPIGGVDGSLEKRFRGTILDGKIFAKTGTLKGTNALSGYLTAASGQTLIFSIMANERPLAISSATPMMDAALVRIAEAY